MAKSPEMEKFLNGVFPKRAERMAAARCVTCGSEATKPGDFKNDLSRREYQISRMCQECQDSVFTPPSED